MIIYLGADHQGFEFKEKVKEFLTVKGYKVVDLGNDKYEEGDDYPDFAELVAEKVSEDSENNRGILFCRSGAGMNIVANKFKNIRSVLGFDKEQARLSKNDDDTNILVIPTGFIPPDDAKEIIKVWLITNFSGEERHKRRLEKIKEIEK